jgi:hypothetical protein
MVSGNWIQVSLGIFIFLFAEFLILRMRGWPEMRRRWLESVGIGVVSVFAGWVTLFLYSVIVTTYHDHFDVNGRWRAVVNEKNQLKGLLTTRDKYITRLQEQVATKPGTVTKTVTVSPENKCWLDHHFGIPNSTVKGAVTATAVIIHCNHKIEAPFRAVIEMDREFITGAVVMSRAGVMLGGGEQKQGRVCIASVEGPALLSESLLIVTVYGPTDQYPRAIKGDVQTIK